LETLWVVIAFPLAAFLVLAIFGGRFSQTAVSLIGVGSAAGAAVLAISTAYQTIAAFPNGFSFESVLWT
jgi:NADH-quinone oxidoreductase subunit L